MKPKARSKSSRCLFCFRNCSNLQANSLWKDEIPGSVHCTTLKRQLQNLFVLRYILDIDASWCEKTLSRRAEAEEEFKQTFVDLKEDSSIPSDNGNLESWFKLCDNCVVKVEESWRLHQKILGIQSRINVLKEEIKDEMRDGIKKNGRRNKGSLEDDIRKLVFPDQESGCDVFIEDDEPSQEACSDDNDDLTFSPLDAEMDDLEVVELCEPKPVIRSPKLLKRKRGRPPKSMSALISQRYLSRKRPGREDKDKERRLWQCSKCKSKYRECNQDRIRIHLERHKKSEEMGGGEFDCSECSFPAQDAFELHAHFKSRHQYHHKKKKYKCSKEGCEYITRIRKELREHVKENHPELDFVEEDPWEKEKATFQCSLCTLVFHSARSLAAHQRSKHPQLLGLELEELQCSHCDMKFTTKIYLQDHIYNVHMDQCHLRPFLCDDCGRRFPTAAHLRQHQIMHSDQSKREHVCHICGVDYPRKQNLTKHLREVHGDGAKASNVEAIKCRHCTFETPFRAVLKKHIESHKEEMGFKCHICSKAYTSDQGLKRHHRINHSTDIVEVACPYCNKKFVTQEYMKDHLRKFCKMKKLKEQQQQNNTDSKDGGFLLGS